MSLPAPGLLVRPLLALYLTGRSTYHYLARVLICEPLFKAYCAQYGRDLHTGVFVHWVQGRGRMILGDDVLVDGRCSFTFAVRYVEDPTLRIGDHVRIGHNSSFTVGREITIGNHCLIASGVQLFDSPGHPTEPSARKAGEPARPEDVRPIHIEDGVWIGRNAIIFPGVTIGAGSVVATGSVVMSNVPPAVVVAGNPARPVARVGGEPKEPR